MKPRGGLSAYYTLRPYVIFELIFAGYTFRFLLDMSILSIQTLVPASARGDIVGLLGLFDGNVDNDFTNSSGDIVCVPEMCTSRLLHDHFGESCKYYSVYIIASTL